MKTKQIIKKSSLALALILLSGCAKPKSATIEQISEKSVESLGCVFAESYLIHQMASPLIEGESLPPVGELVDELKDRLIQERERGQLQASDQAVEEFLSQYEALYRFVSEELVPSSSSILSKATSYSPNEHLQLLMEVEMGDASSEQKEVWQAEWQRRRRALSESLFALDGRCEEPLPIEEQLGEEPIVKPEAHPLLEHWRRNLAAPVYGAHKTFATAYQSCEVVDRRAMVASDPSVRGVAVIGRHPAGGNIREISSVSQVVSSHYYIKDEARPDASCFNLKQNPLIYDFGGKPGATNSLSSNLDMFRDAGTGGKHLGIDCSGYAFTAYAVAGLKMRHDRPLSAAQVFGISAKMMKEPHRNGLGCLQQETVELAPGDLIASNGHVVVVDEVGSDPFGVAGIADRSSCTRANMNPARYNFVISHSAPVKGAIGINRMQASAYFVGSSTMANGVRDYAVTACLARFGERRQAPTAQIAVVRHKGTSECKAQPLQLARQECLSHCPMR